MICHAHRWLWAHRLDQSCSAMQRYSSETKHDCCNFVHIACLTYHICSYSSLFSASFNKVMISTFKQQVWRKPVKHLDLKARTKFLKHGHSSIKTWTHSFDYAYLRKKITLIWTSTFRAPEVADIYFIDTGTAAEWQKMFVSMNGRLLPTSAALLQIHSWKDTFCKYWLSQRKLIFHFLSPPGKERLCLVHTCQDESFGP